MTVDSVTVDDEALRREVRRLFRRHRRLRAFPLLATLVSVPLLFVLLWVFKRVTFYLGWATTEVFGLSPFWGIVEAFFVALAVFFGGFALVVAASNAAVIHNTRRILDDEPVSITAGLWAVARTLPQLAVLAVVWAEGGGAYNALERREHPGKLAKLVTRTLGIDVAGSMYFAVPAAVLDREGPVEMFRTSYRVTEAAFDGPTIVSFGYVKACVLGYGLPVWLLVGLVVPVDAILSPGPSTDLMQQHPFLVGGLPVALLWLGVCTGFAFAAAAKTMLYLEAVEDREPVSQLDRSVAELVS